jgi:CubicO group peptidase (beta-lactamase class C family)
MRAVTCLLAVLVACGRGEPSRPPISDAEIVKQLENYADGLAGNGRFSGAVAIAKHDKALMQRAWGLASRAWNVPNSAGTRFNLGSMNKMFTAVAIGQLLERGKLYRPAGMQDTDCYDLASDPPNLATGYTQIAPDGKPDPSGRWWSNVFLHVVRGGPAGGSYPQRSRANS